MTSNYRQRISEFAGTAETFCRLIDRRQDLTLNDLTMELDALLPHLYLGARNLAASAPDDLLHLEPSAYDENIDFMELIQSERIDSDNFELLMSDLAAIFGRQDVHFEGVDYRYSYVYEEELEPDGPETQVFRHNNSEELAAIYVSLRNGLETFGRGGGQDVENAARDWLFGFYGEWGEFIPHLIQETFRLAHATISDEERSVDL